MMESASFPQTRDTSQCTVCEPRNIDHGPGVTAPNPTLLLRYRHEHPLQAGKRSMRRGLRVGVVDLFLGSSSRFYGRPIRRSPRLWQHLWRIQRRQIMTVYNAPAAVSLVYVIAHPAALPRLLAPRSGEHLGDPHGSLVVGIEGLIHGT